MIQAALRNPYLVVVLALGALVLGTVSYRKIPADLLPIFDTPAVQIVTFCPGMPPEVMERDIMSRLERWTGQSVGIEHQEAKAMLGVSVVKDFFREGTSLDTAMSQVTSYAVSDMFYLPPGSRSCRRGRVSSRMDSMSGRGSSRSEGRDELDIDQASHSSRPGPCGRRVLVERAARRSTSGAATLSCALRRGTSS